MHSVIALAFFQAVYLVRSSKSSKSRVVLQTTPRLSPGIEICAFNAEEKLCLIFLDDYLQSFHLGFKLFFENSTNW